MSGRGTPWPDIVSGWEQPGQTETVYFVHGRKTDYEILRRGHPGSDYVWTRNTLARHSLRLGTTRSDRNSLLCPRTENRLRDSPEGTPRVRLCLDEEHPGQTIAPERTAPSDPPANDDTAPTIQTGNPSDTPAGHCPSSDDAPKRPSVHDDDPHHTRPSSDDRPPTSSDKPSVKRAPLSVKTSERPVLT